MRKICSLLFAACLILGVGMSNASCTKEPDEGTETTETRKDGYLVLNSYTETLIVGQTFSLSVYKIEDGETKSIQHMSLTSEAENVVSVSGTTLTAKREGAAYVHVKADGYTAACFVSVVAGYENAGAVICINEGYLYNGVGVQAQAYIKSEGKLTYKATNVSWSVEGEGTVSSDGIVVPTDTQMSMVIKGSFTYEGQTYEARETFVVKKPIYYAADKNEITLVGSKTLSGKENDKFLTGDVQIKALNFCTGEENPLGEVAIRAEANGTDVNVSEVVEGKFTLTGVNSGETKITVYVEEQSVPVICRVATPLSSVADMDALAMASVGNSNTDYLKGKYILVNDIDYEGEVILPICAYGFDNTNRVTGYQWKYWLTKTADGYTMVDRENVGKSGYGLTDEQFIAFANAKGFNPNGIAFTGDIDGNGYSIKNGQIFYGAVVIPTASGAKGYCNAIFGGFNGTLCNIGFENLTIQNPADYCADSDTWDITKVYQGSIQENALGLKDGKYILRGGSIIASAKGARIYNVYAEIDYEGLSRDTAYINGGIILIGSNLQADHCIMWVKNSDLTYPMSGAGSTNAGTFSYCLGLGCIKIESQIATVSAYGNYWLKEGTWSDLLGLEASGSNPTIQQTIASFDSRVWNLGGLTNGKPQLVKGCWENIR